MSRVVRELAPCEVTPNCLECPLPLCRYDGKAGLAEYDRWRQARYRQRIQELALAGLSIPTIALATGVTPRTVYRRKEAAAPN